MLQAQKRAGRGRGRKVQKGEKISPVLQAKIGARVEKIFSVKQLVVYHLWGGAAIFLGGKGRKVALPGGHLNRFPESVQTSGYFQFSSSWGCLPDVISKHAWRRFPVYEVWLRQNSPNLLSSYHQPTQCLTTQKKKIRSCELKIDGKLGSNDSNDNEIGKKAIGSLFRLVNTPLSHFFVHFFAVTAWLWCKTS